MEENQISSESMPSSQILTKQSAPEVGISEPQKTASSKLVAFAALAIFFGTVFVVAAIWAYGYFFPAPEAVLGKMAQKMADAKTVEYAGAVACEVSTSSAGDSGEVEKQKINFNVDFGGANDASDQKNLKSAFNFRIKETQYLKGSIDLNLVAAKKMLYFKAAANSPSFGEISGNPFLNQWFEFDPEKVTKNLAQIYPFLEGSIDKNAKVPELTPVQLANLRALTRKAKFISGVQQLKDEEINGIACRHYRITIDKKALSNYIRDFGALMQDQISQQNIGQMIDMVNKADFSNAEIWVSKNDFSLRRVNGRINYKDNYFGLASYSIDIDGQIDFKKIDQPVSIKIPENAKPFSDMLGEILGASVSAQQIGGQTP